MEKIKIPLNHRTKSLLVVGLLFTFFILSNCSDGLPSQSDAFPIIADHFEEVSDRRMVLQDLRKTDGQEGEMFGVSVYSLSLEGTVEFTERCYWRTIRMIGTSGAVTFKTVSYEEGQQALESRGFWDQFKPGTLRNEIHRYNAAEAGERIQFTAEVLFEKSERGWSVPDGSRLKIYDLYQPETSDPDGFQNDPYQEVLEESEMTQRVQHRMSLVRDALVHYRNTEGRFPPSEGGLDSLIQFLKTDQKMVAEGNSLFRERPPSTYNPDSIKYSPRPPHNEFQYTLNETLRPQIYLLEDLDSDLRIGDLERTTLLNAPNWN